MLFWVCLFGSAAVYALVFLAPKFCLAFRLEQIEHENQWRLVELQKRIDHLGRLADACERDPAFIREQARWEFDLRPADEESIAMPDNLSLKIDRPVVAGNRGNVRPQPWYLPALRTVAVSPGVANSLLAAAAVIVVLAFTFLQDVKTPPTARSERPRKPASGHSAPEIWVARQE